MEEPSIPQQKTSARTVCIGGFPIRITADPDAFWPHAEKRYQGFFDETQEPVERVEIRVFSPPHLPPVSEKASARVLQHNETVEISWGNMVAEWHRAQRSGWIRQPESDFTVSERHVREYACDTYLRIILTFRLPDMGGFLLHSAGVVRKGKGYLFVGKSRAGKSTIARLSVSTATILSDDLTLVRATPRGSTIYGTPFFGEFGNGCTNLSAPLEGIYFLVKATTSQAVLLSEHDALKRLMASVLFFSKEEKLVQTILDLGILICHTIPCFELMFPPDDSFWSCIGD